ncbi:MAG: rhodanese-like domain-containing protein [Saprospiraceae bacterium]|nr:rhodanese-like domain-containing protein [Saprospiraceae bacterium]
MLNTLKKLFNGSETINYSQLVKAGAQIVDVRTPGEFSSGHIKGSINIPLQNLSAGLNKIRKDQVVITCCASGMRSATAKNELLQNGFMEVHNGGGWENLEYYLKNNSI